VQRATDLGLPLKDLPFECLEEAGVEIDDSVYEVLGAANAVKALRTRGSSNPELVRAEIARWREQLDGNEFKS
jgi:argininosuccinate lyase